MQRKIGIVGVGMVGNALKKYFEKKPHYQLFCYDKGKNIGSMDELNKADFIYICVPTPTSEDGCDISIIEEIVSQLESGKVAIIKSTVVPGTTAKLQKSCRNIKFLFNPEFLTELTADQDMCYPDRQILGYTKESKNVAGDVMFQLPLAPYERMIPSMEAEMIKYYTNTWFATKVVFANQMYDICKKLDIDYEKVMSGAAADKRIGRTHLKIWHKGYRGYGVSPTSKCIPKDMEALIKFGDILGIDLEQLKITDKINKELWNKYGNKEN